MSNNGSKTLMWLPRSTVDFPKKGKLFKSLVQGRMRKACLFQSFILKVFLEKCTSNCFKILRLKVFASTVITSGSQFSKNTKLIQARSNIC